MKIDSSKRETMTKPILTCTLKFCMLFSYKLCVCHMTSCHYIQAVFHSDCASCHSSRSNKSASFWCMRRWATGGLISFAASGTFPARLCHPTFSAPCGRIACFWQCMRPSITSDMVEGRPFVIFTDHKLLTYAFQQRRDKCSPRQFRHLEFIGQFSTDFRHVSRQDNVVAAALSRANSVMTPLDYHALASS